jgi:hypothetical protein
MKKRSKQEINKKFTSKKRVGKWLFWTPRILSIIFILFLVLMSLDIFGNNYTFWETILGLFMHNIPALILLVVLIISWKHELVGAIVFALAGLLYIAMILKNIFTDFSVLYQLFWTLQISAPAFLIAYLFYLNYKRKKN